MTAATPIEYRLAEGLSRAGLDSFEVAVVLGSGLGAFAESLDEARAVPFEEVDGMPVAEACPFL